MQDDQGGFESEIRIDGMFDVLAAQRVSEALSRAPRSEAFCVDLTRVRDFEDLGVAKLADALSTRGDMRVSVRGLRPHQRRLLRYLGVEPSAIEAGISALAQEPYGLESSAP